LRVASKPYRKRYGVYEQQGRIKNRIGIEYRPAVVDRRNRVGDWEGDTVMGKGRKSALLTLVERKILYMVIARLTGKRADRLAKVAIDSIKHLKSRIKTITLDNRLEFVAHDDIAKGLKTDIYFEHTYASWERGINENINGLIQQYFPKGTNFSKVTNEKIMLVMNRLNNRTRATRSGYSPNELFMGQREDLLAT